MNNNFGDFLNELKLFSRAVHELEDALHTEHVQTDDVLSASRHADNFKQAIHGVKEQYKKLVQEHQRKVTLTRALTGGTYAGLAFLNIMAILSPYKAGDIDTATLIQLSKIQYHWR